MTSRTEMIKFNTANAVRSSGKLASTHWLGLHILKNGLDHALKLADSTRKICTRR